LIVTAPDAAFDPEVDHVIVIGRRDASEASSVLEDRDSVILNGARSPRWVWSGGATHRIRLINITPDDLLRVTLVNGDATTATWRVVAKDGSPVPADRIASVPATVTLAVGETIDVEYDPAPNRSGTRWLEVRGPSGKWQAQGQVILK
jgi:FtsP/CotA-like multicopper oxidase with cupredoxin domain